jgi:CBS domain-containing protein
VADLRPGGFPRAEDELVEELDREQDGDEAGGSAPAARPVLTGRPRKVHRRILPVWRFPARGRIRKRKKGVLMAKTIREVMTDNPRTLKLDATLVDAAKIMRDEDTGVVPITDGDSLMGLITDRDIAIRAVAEGKDPTSMKVRDCASKELVTIDPQQSLDEALRLMAKHQVRRLPVVEDDNRLIGIVAQADIARAGDDARTGEVVQQISR